MKEYVNSWTNLVIFAKLNYGLKELSKVDGLVSRDDFEEVNANPFCCRKSHVIWDVWWGAKGQAYDGAEIYWWNKDHLERSYIRLERTTYIDFTVVFEKCGWKAIRSPLILPSEGLF